MRFIFPTGIYEKVIYKDKPGGYAGLDSSGLLNLDEIPAELTGKDADSVDGLHDVDIENIALIKAIVMGD